MLCRSESELAHELPHQDVSVLTLSLVIAKVTVEQACVGIEAVEIDLRLAVPVELHVRVGEPQSPVGAQLMLERGQDLARIVAAWSCRGLAEESFRRQIAIVDAAADPRIDPAEA